MKGVVRGVALASIIAEGVALIIGRQECRYWIQAGGSITLLLSCVTHYPHQNLHQQCNCGDNPTNMKCSIDRLRIISTGINDCPPAQRKLHTRIMQAVK